MSPKKTIDNPDLAQVWFNMGTTEINLGQLPHLFADEEDPLRDMYLRGYVMAGIANNAINLSTEELEALAQKAIDTITAPPKKELILTDHLPKQKR